MILLNRVTDLLMMGDLAVSSVLHRLGELIKRYNYYDTSKP